MKARIVWHVHWFTEMIGWRWPERVEWGTICVGSLLSENTSRCIDRHDQWVSCTNLPESDKVKVLAIDSIWVEHPCTIT